MGADDYFVTGRESLTTRRAGTSAREKAQSERAKAPLRTRLERVLRVHTDERAWRRGADGEERMGRLLEVLSDDWHVFHDLPIGSRGANIDHLVVGPGGVFTVNTKNLTGNVWVASRALLHNGRKTAYLPRAAAEAQKAGVRLSRAIGTPVDVIAVLAIFADSLTIKERPEDVSVVRGAQLAAWLRGRPADVTGPEVFAIARAADDPATWKPSLTRFERGQGVEE